MARKKAAAAQATSEFAPQTYTVRWPSGVNLRPTPGMDQAPLSVLPDGAEVTSTGNASGAWLPVRTADGAAGWMMAEYLRRKED